jgi:nucleotide-binding universal stress UspA family protein
VIGRLVVGVDGSDASAAALRWALNEARVRSATVDVVHGWVYPYVGDIAGMAASVGADDLEQAARAVLDRSIRAAVSPPSEVTPNPVLVHGAAAPVLLDAARGAELLVVGSRGRGGFTGLLLGSVSQHCLHHSTCPVAVVRNAGDPAKAMTMERIVVGIDGSDAARHALAWAVEEARLRKASLEVVHAWHMPWVGGYPYTTATFDPTELENRARRTLEAAIDGVDTSELAHPIQRVLSTSGAASAVLEAAKGADLLVVGSRGLGGFSGLLLGSVSHHVAHHATCPVVIVPPPR